MDVEQLRLEQVRALLAQAGRGLPDAQGLGDMQFVQALLDALCELSTRDPLTGLNNRRALLAEMARELDRVARSGESALLLLVDIDHFKAVNDRHGHLTGDAVLRAVAQGLSEAVRPMDVVARFGGEEFAVVLPNCPPSLAGTVAERIRQRVQALHVPYQDLTPLRVTVSCGGAFAPGWESTAADDWIARADAQMYRAKHGGRNQVCLESWPPNGVSAEEKGLLFGLLPGGTGMMDAQAGA